MNRYHSDSSMLEKDWDIIRSLSFSHSALLSNAAISVCPAPLSHRRLQSEAPIFLYWNEASLAPYSRGESIFALFFLSSFLLTLFSFFLFCVCGGSLLQIPRWRLLTRIKCFCCSLRFAIRKLRLSSLGSIVLRFSYCWLLRRSPATSRTQGEKSSKFQKVRKRSRKVAEKLNKKGVKQSQASGIREQTRRQAKQARHNEVKSSKVNPTKSEVKLGQVKAR